MDETTRRLIEDHQTLVALCNQYFSRQIRIRSQEDQDDPLLDEMKKLANISYEKIKAYSLPEEQKDKILLHVQSKEVQSLESHLINAKVFGECIDCRHLDGNRTYPETPTSLCKIFDKLIYEFDIYCNEHEPISESELTPEERYSINKFRAEREKELQIAKQILAETKDMMKKKYG